MAVTALVMQPITALTIRLPREKNRLVEAVKASVGEQLFLTYRHSVEKTKVQGVFEVAGKGLLNLATKMESVGTGLPNTSPERTTRQGKWLVVDEGKKLLPNIRFFLSPINQTQLTIGRKALDLNSLKSGSLLVIGVEHPSLAAWLKYIAGFGPWTPQGGQNEEIH